MSCDYNRYAAHECLQMNGSTTTTTTPMNEAVNHGLCDVVEALRAKGVKLITDHVSCNNCNLLYTCFNETHKYNFNILVEYFHQTLTVK